MALNASDILGLAGVFEPVPLHVPEWKNGAGDDLVYLRGLTLREFELLSGTADKGEGTASVLAKCLLDEAGGRLFNKDNVHALAELPVKGANRVSQKIMEVSGLSGDDDSDDAVNAAVEKAGNDSGTTGSGEPSSV